MRVDVALGLGSNLGRSEEILASALLRLRVVIRIRAIAPLFRSRAEGPGRQPDYLNTAVVGSCDLAADDLLAVTKQLEYDSGRRRGRRNRPRRLDIDLLLCGPHVIRRPELTVPHPRLGQRRFVLAPLARIAPGWTVPPTGITVSDLLTRLDDRDPIIELEWHRGQRPAMALPRSDRDTAERKPGGGRIL